MLMYRMRDEAVAFTCSLKGGSGGMPVMQHFLRFTEKNVALHQSSLKTWPPWRCSDDLCMKEEHKTEYNIYIWSWKVDKCCISILFFSLCTKINIFVHYMTLSAHCLVHKIWSAKKDITVNCIFNYMGCLNWFQVDTSPARWWVWISSRPVRVLSDLRSLKATTGTMSSSLVSPSCKVLVPTGSWAASSMVPLCTGSVFSFGCAAFGELLAGAVFCRKRNIKKWST